MLFAADTPWVWDAERTFTLLQKQELENRQTREDIMLKDMSTRHYEKASQGNQGGPSRQVGSSSDVFI